MYEFGLGKKKKKIYKNDGKSISIFRGSAYLFYYDMTKILFSYHTDENKPTWIQDDLHMENFGAFQNENSEIVYDVNDFEEGYIGSNFYDVLRMSVSIALYGKQQGLSTDKQRGRIKKFQHTFYLTGKTFGINTSIKQKRVVATEKAMHHLEDPHLGYLKINERYFYVRERSP
ncbi:MAG TPA: DUF2252 family protein [Ureibacillus sp.]|nr:DUF2252 family protein [Ureibacillus sp.]